MPRLEPLLSLRYVRTPVAYGLHAERTPSLQLYEDGTLSVQTKGRAP